MKNEKIPLRIHNFYDICKTEFEKSVSRQSVGQSRLAVANGRVLFYVGIFLFGSCYFLARVCNYHIFSKVFSKGRSVMKK
jgi:hypothetical protein